MGSMMKLVETAAMAMGYIILEGLMFILSHMFWTSGWTSAKMATILGTNCPMMQVITT